MCTTGLKKTAQILEARYQILELDELYWFVGQKPQTETRENVCLMTMVSRQPRQIGRFPSHWDVAPLFTIAKENKAKNTGNVCSNLLSLSYGRIIRKDIKTTTGLLPENFEGYQIVDAGYSVLRLTDMQNDKHSLRTGFVSEKGIITNAYLGLIPISEEIDPQYLSLLLHAYDLKKIFYAFGNGIRQTLKFSDIKRLPILIPPLQEQREIVKSVEARSLKIESKLAEVYKVISELAALS